MTMEREEAIEMLKALNMMLRSPNGEPISDACDALDMAIEALQDKEGESQFYTEDDYWNGMFTESEEAYKAWTGEEIGKTGDLVKKKDAIAVAVKTCWNCSNYRCDEIKTALYALPTVSVDRPHGEWVLSHIGTIAEGYYCSRCGKHGYQTDFCHNCGADMKGEKMTINEKKMQIVIDNYFKSECNVDTSIRDAFEKGFRIGVKKTANRPTGEWILVCDGGGECDNLYRCSHCGQEVGCEEYDKPKFCGECGSDMRGEK